MGLPSVSAVEIADRDPSRSADTRLRERQLLMGRILWLAVAVFGLSMLAATIDPTLHQLQTVCSVPPCTASQVTPAQARTLQTTLGLSLGAYAIFAFSVSAATALCTVGVSALFWRKLGQAVPLVVALQLMTQGVLGSNAFAINGLVDVLIQAHSPWQVPGLLLEVANQLLLIFVLALFPTGRFVPRWTRWAAGLWIVLDLLYFVGHISSPLRVTLPPFLPVFSGMLLLLIAAQIYRYLQVSTGIERQQTKWVIFGVIMLNVVQFVLLLPGIAFAPLRQPDSLYGPMANQAVILGYLFLPICVTVAVMRSRLWDIDTIINKALVYGLLTSLLGATYVGLIIAMENLVGRFSGLVATNPVVPVISTLVIAALFQPLRKRSQTIIDRRFYRKKYDAEKTLGAFSNSLRNQVDLEQIGERLLASVQEAMQPAHVTLWLRTSERRIAANANMPSGYTRAGASDQVRPESSDAAPRARH